LDRSLAKDTEEYTKLTSLLRKALVGEQWKDGDKELPRDPYLSNLGILIIMAALQKHIRYCHEKQNDYRERLLAQQEACCSFEKVIIQNIKVSLSTFYEFRSTQYSQQYDLAMLLGKTLESFEADKDWEKFMQVNSKTLLNVKIPPIHIKDVVYDGHDDLSITILKEGPLLRKEGVILKSYKPFHAILTHSGYFHVCSAISNTGLPEAPDISLDLTECSLQPLMMNEADPEEIAIYEKTKGMFGNERKHKVCIFYIRCGEKVCKKVWNGGVRLTIQSKKSLKGLQNYQQPYPAISFLNHRIM
jgi:hypothetical protein